MLHQSQLPFPLDPGVDLQRVQCHDQAARSASKGLGLGEVLLAQVEVCLHVSIVQRLFEKLLACLKLTYPAAMSMKS